MIIFLIALPVLFQFRAPKIEFRFGKPCERAFPPVSVPKTSVNENDFASAAKHQIRLSGQFSIVQSVPESERMNQAPHHELRLGVLAAHQPHACGSLGGCKRVHRTSSPIGGLLRFRDFVRFKDIRKIHIDKFLLVTRAVVADLRLQLRRTYSTSSARASSGVECSVRTSPRPAQESPRSRIVRMNVTRSPPF
jgi:hypothetical protein